MQITLTDDQLAGLLQAHMPTGYVLSYAGPGWQWQNNDRNAFGARQPAINAFIDAWRDFDGRGARDTLAKIRALVG